MTKTNIKKLAISTVNEFMNDVIGNLQKKAEQMTQITGDKSTLDFVIKDLKNKFGSFLKKYEK